MTADICVLPVSKFGMDGSGRIFAGGSDAGLWQHEQTFGHWRAGFHVEAFLDAVQDSGLTGRGGAGFSAWRKLATAADSVRAERYSKSSGGAIVIANGAESEPLSSKDKTLLKHAPHLVIDGALVAAEALRASQLVIYASEESLVPVIRALSERKDATGVKLVRSPETFIAGESSAVVHAVAGGPALPQDKPAGAGHLRVGKRTAVVFNVETLAHMALIARFGAAWFRSAGTGSDPGTRLVTVTAPGHRQVLEVAGGESLATVFHVAGIDRAQVRAVLLGGYHGRWVEDPRMDLSPSSIPDQAGPGAGVIHILPKGRCGLLATAGMVTYLAGQSARQCGPCTFGLPALAATFGKLAHGVPDPGLVDESRRLATVVSGRGACHHPDGTARLMRSALEIFDEDVAAHLAGHCIEEGGRRHG